MNKATNSLRGRIRDKVKQVILIEGIPDVLYKIREHKVAVIKFNNKSYRLDVPDDLIKELKKLSTIEIKVSTRSSKQFKPIVIPGLGHRTTIRAVNGNTHITIGAADENQLSERIQIIREYLISLGITTTERCHWVCSTNKAKPNTDYSYPHKLPGEQRVPNWYASTVASAFPDKNKSTIETIEKKVDEKKEMSKHTKSLREIALKTIKESKA